MPAPMRLENRTALITGAASGIGQALALALARRRCHLALADINESGVMQTARQAQEYGVRVSVHHLDVTDAAAVAAFPTVVRETHPCVDLLFNNAGVAIWGTFEDVHEDDFDWLFGINFHGVVRMTRAFLPLLKVSDDACIINISSVFGLIAPSQQVAYAASKFAVRGFSEALRHELHGTHVGVAVVHPGGIATAISERARHPAHFSAEEVEARRAASRQVLRMPPSRAAEIIIKGVERRQKRILVGADAWLVDILARMLPGSYWRVIERFR